MALGWHREGVSRRGGSLVRGTGQLYGSWSLLDLEQYKNKLQFLLLQEGGREEQPAQPWIIRSFILLVPRGAGGHSPGAAGDERLDCSPKSPSQQRGRLAGALPGSSPSAAGAL